MNSTSANIQFARPAGCAEEAGSAAHRYRRAARDLLCRSVNISCHSGEAELEHGSHLSTLSPGRLRYFVHHPCVRMQTPVQVYAYILRLGKDHCLTLASDCKFPSERICPFLTLCSRRQAGFVRLSWIYDIQVSSLNLHAVAFTPTPLRCDLHLYHACSQSYITSSSL